MWCFGGFLFVKLYVFAVGVFRMQLTGVKQVVLVTQYYVSKTVVNRRGFFIFVIISYTYIHTCIHTYVNIYVYISYT